MSVLMQFSIFPTDKGKSVSKYVSQVIAMVRESGYPFRLTAICTIVETHTLEECQEIVNKACHILAKDCERVYCTVTFDIRNDTDNRLEGKIQSIEEKIGKVNP